MARETQAGQGQKEAISLSQVRGMLLNACRRVAVISHTPNATLINGSDRVTTLGSQRLIHRES